MNLNSSACAVCVVFNFVNMSGPCQTSSGKAARQQKLKRFELMLAAPPVAPLTSDTMPKIVLQDMEDSMQPVSSEQEAVRRTEAPAVLTPRLPII